jgi:hypothetical protein
MINRFLAIAAGVALVVVAASCSTVVPARPALGVTLSPETVPGLTCENFDNPTPIALTVTFALEEAPQTAARVVVPAKGSALVCIQR